MTPCYCLVPALLINRIHVYMLNRRNTTALLFRDDENRRFSNHGLSAHVTRQYPKEQSVNVHARSVCLCRLLKASTTIPPTLLTPASVPVAKTTLGRPIRLRIGVTATWHGQQSTISMLWDYPCPTGVVVRRLDCKPETPTARDSSRL